MTKPAVCHWEVMGKDGDKTRDFYTHLFDWEIQKLDGGDYGLVAAAGEGTIGGGIGGANEGDWPGLLVYVQVDDLDKYLEKAESLGGTKVLGPTPIPGHGSMALFKDLDGVTVGLFRGGK